MEFRDYIAVIFLAAIWAFLAIMILLNRPPAKEKLNAYTSAPLPSSEVRS